MVNNKKLFLIFNSYDECLKIEPNNSTTWNSKGNAFCDLKEHDEAIKW